MKIEANLSIQECVVTYFLMMAVIIIGGFTGQWWLTAFGLPLFLRGITGFCPLKSLLKQDKA